MPAPAAIARYAPGRRATEIPDLVEQTSRIPIFQPGSDLTGPVRRLSGEIRCQTVLLGPAEHAVQLVRQCMQPTCHHLLLLRSLLAEPRLRHREQLLGPGGRPGWSRDGSSRPMGIPSSMPDW